MRKARFIASIIFVVALSLGHAANAAALNGVMDAALNVNETCSGSVQAPELLFPETGNSPKSNLTASTTLSGWSCTGTTYLVTFSDGRSDGNPNDFIMTG